MTRRIRSRREALEGLQSFLEDVGRLVDVVLVEGLRDVEALRSLGFDGEIEVCSRVGILDYDLVDLIRDEYGCVLILTDFDDEGREMNKRFSSLFEHRGVKVERGMRRGLGRLMAAIGVYAIESLDNVKDDVEARNRD